MIFLLWWEGTWLCLEQKLPCCYQHLYFRHYFFHNKMNPTCSWTSSPVRNPVNSEDIAIFCHNIILFIRITPVRNNLALKRGKICIYLCCDLLIFIPALQYSTFSHSLFFPKYWDRIKQEKQDNLKRVLNWGWMHAKHGWGKVGWLHNLGSPGLVLLIYTGHLLRETTGDSVVP